MVLNILTLAFFGWLFSLGFKRHYEELMDNRDVEHNKLISNIEEAYRLMQRDHSDMKLKLTKCHKTIHEQRAEIFVLKEDRK